MKIKNIETENERDWKENKLTERKRTEAKIEICFLKM